MAKKKKKSGGTSGSPRLAALTDAAKKGHKSEVGAGGSVFDPMMSHVRGIRLPSVAMMDMLGVTALRDSCTVLIDGAPASSKSSLAIEMFNWGAPYGASGAIIDCENKGAFDIAAGTLGFTTLWLPDHLRMITAPTVEAAQGQIKRLVEKCREINQDLERNEQLPFLCVTDPLAGTPSEETKKAITKNSGASDRGHGGRVEALLWSIWLKDHESDILDLPFVSVFVNHVKERSKQGSMATEKYNPGGSSQNYATTIALRCTKSKSKSLVSQSVDGISHDYIIIKCTKNSRGPEGKSIGVRKCSMRQEDGSTIFWWDWGRTTVDWLSSLSSAHPSKDIVKVTKSTEAKASCSTLGLKDENPSDVGDAIMKDEKIVEELIKACRFYRLKEFEKLTEDEAASLNEQAQANYDEFNNE